MRIACLTSTDIPVAATPPNGCELVEYQYANPFPAGPVANQICDLIVAGVGIRAVEDGCDAIVINTVADFGARLLRDIVRGPVVGGAYAAVTAAGALGSRFSLVSIWPPATVEIVKERFRDYGVSDRCVSMRFCTPDDAELANAQYLGETFSDIAACDMRYVDRVSTEIDNAIAEDSPDVIIFGCTCMSPAAARFSERSAIPVLDATQLAVDLAASLGAHHGPMTLNDVDAARFWVGSISRSIRELGGKASELYAEDLASLGENSFEVAQAAGG